MLLFLFLLVITRVYAPFDQSLALIAELFVSQVSADRMNEIYDTPTAEGAEVFRSLEALRAAAPADSFVIGGESVYAALLDWCDTAYITKIGQAWEGADAFFPDLGAGPDWEMAEEGEPQEHAGIPFRYVTYRRRKPHVCG